MFFNLRINFRNVYVINMFVYAVMLFFLGFM